MSWVSIGYFFSDGSTHACTYRPLLCIAWILIGSRYREFWKLDQHLGLFFVFWELVPGQFL